MKVKPGFTGDARIVRCMPRKAAEEVWNQPKRGEFVAVNKLNRRSWRSEECFDIRHGIAEFGVCPGSGLGPVFPQYAPFLPFGMVMNVLLC